MLAVPDLDTFTRYVRAVRRAPATFTGNLYAGTTQVERWCAAGKLRALTGEGATLFLRADRGFERVYHLAEDQSALATVLAMLPPGTYVTDLIGQDQGVEPTCATYAAAGFSDRTMLRRLTHDRTNPGPEAGDVEVASAETASEVLAFLDRLLDPLAEQLPDREELEEAARDERLLLVREGGPIAGMLMYDRKGQLGHLRFWHVDPQAHGRGVGRRLMAAFLARCADAKRLILWVIGDNHRSIAIYGHYGFAPDGLIDRIMILDKEAVT